MSTRIYLVTDTVTQTHRLIDAASQAQAIRHAIKGRFEVKVAGQKDLLAHMKLKSGVESAAQTEEAEAEPEAGTEG